MGVKERVVSDSRRERIVAEYWLSLSTNQRLVLGAFAARYRMPLRVLVDLVKAIGPENDA